MRDVHPPSGEGSITLGGWFHKNPNAQVRAPRLEIQARKPSGHRPCSRRAGGYRAKSCIGGSRYGEAPPFCRQRFAFSQVRESRIVRRVLFTRGSGQSVAKLPKLIRRAPPALAACRRGPKSVDESPSTSRSVLGAGIFAALVDLRGAGAASRVGTAVVCSAGRTNNGHR